MRNNLGAVSLALRVTPARLHRQKRWAKWWKQNTINMWWIPTLLLASSLVQHIGHFHGRWLHPMSKAIDMHYSGTLPICDLHIARTLDGFYTPIPFLPRIMFASLLWAETVTQYLLCGKSLKQTNDCRLSSGSPRLKPNWIQPCSAAQHVHGLLMSLCRRMWDTRDQWFWAVAET